MKIRAVIDRIEGEFAVLLVGEQEVAVDWPKSLLPVDFAEGDILNFQIEIDKKETTNQKEKVTALLEKLQKK